MNMNQDKQSAAYGYTGHTHPGGYMGGVTAVLGGNFPPPSPISVMQEASEAMDRDISEVMSLADLLSARLSVVLRPDAPSAGQNCDNKVEPSCSPFVEIYNRQRRRIQAIGAQLQNLLNRAEV